MRDKSVDEFQAIFERASIPVLDIKPITLRRIAMVVKGVDLDPAALQVAAGFTRRFNAEALVYWPATLSMERVESLTKELSLKPAGRPFQSTAELVGQISIGHADLVVLPEPAEDSQQPVMIDSLVSGTGPPVLILRRPPAAEGAPFRRVLHSLTGNFRQTVNFSFPFALVEPGGTVELLHVIDDEEIADVRETLQISSDIAIEDREKLVQEMAHHGERFLKAVVESQRKGTLNVTYRIVVGDIVTTVENSLKQGSYDLLVVGHHAGGRSHVFTADYQLMHKVKDVAVLAL